MGNFTEFKVPLKSLPQGSHAFNYHLGKAFFENMESADIHDADLSVALDVSVKGDLYALSFVIEGSVTITCDRCLDDMNFPLRAEYNISVKYGDDFNDGSDTLLQIPYADNFLDVAHMIYDTVSLAIPIKHVHPGGKCNQAMCDILCRHNAAAPDDDGDDTGDYAAEGGSHADPRWDALRKLSADIIEG